MVIFMYYYLNNFLLYSIFGFCYENILHLITKQHMTSNPFVGFWMPIYGFGIVIMIFLTRLVFNRLKAPRYAKVICLFFSTFIILTILEQIGGMLTEAVFYRSFWDYSSMKFNYGKYISLEVSMFWGISCLLFLYLLKPLSDKLIRKIPSFITNIFFLLFIVDFIYSFFLK